MTAKIMVGPLAQAGVAAVQGGIERLRTLLHEVVACPGAECGTHAPAAEASTVAAGTATGGESLRHHPS
ncbi:hypothetical protein JKI95_04705 [Corynebacterium aquatimens]|uniref:hypothetical protein n=1 Tax=Corynebacterium aquatimens TaxID=1190508 RepID=UPI002540E4E7|nr:hypothetical protein [Corynebacterium aquatimens]QYH20222.1 hypothetical protein JKI95_04705 [Corynebacterium aquatimens]